MFRIKHENENENVLKGNLSSLDIVQFVESQIKSNIDRYNRFGVSLYSNSSVEYNSPMYSINDVELWKYETLEFLHEDTFKKVDVDFF